MLRPTRKITKREIKEDPLVTAYVKVQRFLRENSKILNVGFTIVIIVLANTSGRNAWEVSGVLARIIFGYEYELPPEEVILLSVEDLQGTEMGRRALALLDIYTETDVAKTEQFIQENFAPEFIERASPERLFEFIRTDQEGIGEANIGKIEQTAETTLELTVQSQRTGQWWLITLVFEAESPFRISRAGVTDTMPPSF